MNTIHKRYWLELYVFCMDYHSGQWSRGYRILSRLSGYYRANVSSSTACKEARESAAYKYLEANYANTV